MARQIETIWRFWPFFMPRCNRNHLKRLAAPHHWMLAKTAGKFATKPVSGPHKASESLPVILLLRNRLKYALNAREVTTICKRRLVTIDGKIRTDPRYPAGLMDVISLGQSKEQFRLLYDAKGRFTAHAIDKTEAGFKLLRVNKFFVGDKGVTHLVTHDGRTIRYADPDVRLNDTVKYNLVTGDVEGFYKFKLGSVAMVISGGNVGRVGVVHDIKKQQAGFNIVSLTDSAGNKFATRQANVFILGEGNAPAITLPKRGGVRPSILEKVQQPPAN
jgi:small subunit ribosomal protein S4e